MLGMSQLVGMVALLGEQLGQVALLCFVKLDSFFFKFFVLYALLMCKCRLKMLNDLLLGGGELLLDPRQFRLGVANLTGQILDTMSVEGNKNDFLPRSFPAKFFPPRASLSG
jgi:hypothetical protein